ncbi:MAG: hypothetical protein JOY90_28445 [Bradyrhizobium sp.]|uniref:hypothetical protein n=1 Tax=Bradyrhizobium sp. TaxID=376 RepID=UPI001D9A1280|nr:hypothetical protein [Bradyrhizobium sp.]MBV9564339.1 hypothetical protein [Bradyrhizobium sp.]
MTRPNDATDHLKQYLQQLTQQARSRLLAELERLHLLGQDVPHSQEMIAALRAELRNTGESHYRVGNPSRYFFEPLEPVLVNIPPERVNSGQIARGSLGPIWGLMTEKLLPRMADEYVATIGKFIVANNQSEARRIAAAFQNKVVAYLDGVLKAGDGPATVRAGLDIYTTSRATFDDLTKMLRVIHARQELADFARALPPKIAALEKDQLARILDLLNRLQAKRGDIAPFALAVIAKRLEKPWQLILLATRPARSRAAPTIAATPYALAVSMALDQIDEKRLMLIDALKCNRILPAKEILAEIHAADKAMREHIDLDGSDWGVRLHKTMAGVEAATEAEINSIPSDHKHIVHVLEAVKLRGNNSVGARLSRMVRMAAAGWRSS